MTPPLRALLLTDVVDSTALTQSLGDAAMAPHWAAHDRAARDLLPAWRGREIDKSDGLLVLFDSAADAVGYALAYHRALAALALPFQARAGLHVGPVTLRANSAADIAQGAKAVEVDGLAKPIAARVMALAAGGQTLLTGEARDALGPTAWRLQPHGHWRLRGVPEPVEVHEIGAPEALFTPPPDGPKAYRVVRQGELWLPVREVRHSVPAERDGFVGRQAPLLALARKLQDGARLISVLGMGGTGKTRLVTRFAWSWLGEFSGGVWFCDLSQARTPAGIHFAVAQGLDVPLGKTDPVVQLAHAIAGRGQCLVILDNFEQVARHAEATLGHWLDRAPNAKFIVTTREVLGIVGEDTLALAPLPAADAAALFVRRAESARQGYAPSADDRVAIEQLVKMLDGLPLAIELAAARVRVMAPRVLLSRMSERFKLLWAHAGRQDRQATLRAAFDWSWELLTEAERSALAQLSVFDGSFGLDAAEAVLDLSTLGGGGDAPWAVDVVGWLVDKSFVRSHDDDRFDLLESVREYAAEHLRTEGRFVGSGPAAMTAAEARHGRHYAALDERAATARRCVELGNLVRACRRAIHRGDGTSAVGCLVNAWAALRLCGPISVGAELAAEAIGLPDMAEALQAQVHAVAGSALDLLGRGDDAQRHFDAALRLAIACRLSGCEVRVRLALAGRLRAAGRVEAALEALEAARHAAAASGDASLRCAVENNFGSWFDQQGRYAQARLHYEAALALARAGGDRRMEGGLLGNLGGLHHSLGVLATARDHYERALALAVDVGDRRWEGTARCNLGWLEHQQGRERPARSALAQALGIAREIGFRRLECTVLCNLAIVDEAAADAATARAHQEAAVAIARDLGDRRLEGSFLGYLGLLEARQGGHAAARACLEAAERLLRELADPVTFGVLLCQRAEAAHWAGDATACASHGREAARIAESVGAQADSELGQALHRIGSLTGSAAVV